MTYQPNSRLYARAGAAALACLLMAAGPLSAQDGPADSAQAPTDGAVQPAPAETEPDGAAIQAAGPQAGESQAAPAIADDGPTTAPSVNDSPASDAGTTPDAATAGGAASDPTTAPDAATATQTDAQTDTGTPEASSFTDMLQRHLDPALGAEGRDPTLPHDLSPMGMFLAADWVVKAVMIGLAFASVITWTVLVVKMTELWLASGRVARARRRIEGAADLPAALAATGRRRDPASRMVALAMQEYERSLPSLRGRAGDDGLKDRVASHLMQIEGQASRKISQGTGILATIGSTAPFVGLFGTVWGIMNSFIGISQSQTTNLAVVAPGIAEALLATAIGLVAAIPAVIIYNVFARAITGYRLKLAGAGAGVQRLVSRDLDFRMDA